MLLVKSANAPISLTLVNAVLCDDLPSVVVFRAKQPTRRWRERLAMDAPPPRRFQLLKMSTETFFYIQKSPALWLPVYDWEIQKHKKVSPRHLSFQ